MSQIDSSKLTDKKIRVLFFGRGTCEMTQKALDHIEKLGFDIIFIKSKGRGEKLPEDIGCWDGDYILCFRSFFVLPKDLIEKTKIAAINFHPAPTEYPGSGCLNFALYDDAKLYGVTAHLMNEEVDNGKILECYRFPIFRQDNVDSLLERTHQKLLDLFYDITTGIAVGGEEYIENKLTDSANEMWSGDARKLAELDSLQVIKTDSTKEELERVIRATYTELFPPKVVLYGYEFVLKNPRTE